MSRLETSAVFFLPLLTYSRMLLAPRNIPVAWMKLALAATTHSNSSTRNITSIYLLLSSVNRNSAVSSASVQKFSAPLPFRAILLCPKCASLRLLAIVARWELRLQEGPRSIPIRMVRRTKESNATGNEASSTDFLNGATPMEIPGEANFKRL